MNTKISKTAIAALAVAIIAILLAGYGLYQKGVAVTKTELGADSVPGVCIGGGNDPVSQECNKDINYLNVTTLIVKGLSSFTGKITATGGITGPDVLSTVSTYVASTTLATTDSGKTFILTTTTEFVLPATSTSAGVHYKFVVGSGITATSTVRTSDLGNNIEGTLIVAGAVVDCAAEDIITIGASFENVGDYFELWSNGTYWFIGDSGALTGSALTCTADGS